MRKIYLSYIESNHSNQNSKSWSDPDHVESIPYATCLKRDYPFPGRKATHLSYLLYTRFLRHFMTQTLDRIGTLQSYD